MSFRTIIATLLAGAAIAGASLGAAAPAQAGTVGTVSVTLTGNTYTVVNKYAGYYIYNIVINNSTATALSVPSTTQPGWSAYNCLGSCVGNSPGFVYYSSGLANDIAPGQSSSKFTFSSLFGSTNAATPDAFAIALQDTTNSFFTSVTGTVGTGGPVDSVPEPATWALMLVGLGATGAALRRRGVAPRPVNA